MASTKKSTKNKKFVAPQTTNVADYELMLQEYDQYYERKMELLQLKHDLDVKWASYNNEIYARKTEENFNSALETLQDQRSKKIASINRKLNSELGGEFSVTLESYDADGSPSEGEIIDRMRKVLEAMREDHK
jgi:hypothetical protein